MKCSKCEFDNLPDAKICTACGETLMVATAEQVTSGQETQPVFLPVGSVVESGSTSDVEGSTQQSDMVPEISGKKTFGKSFRVAVTVMILVFAVICSLGFMFRNKILKQINPESYLQVSLSRTFLDNKNAKILDMSKYDDKAVKHEFSVEADGTEAELSVMYDAKGEKALFEGMINDGYEEYDDNLLYISREMFAFSVPELLTDVDVITIDPATFGEELAELGVEPTLSEDYFDYLLDSFFGKSGNEGPNMEEFADYYREAKYLEEIGVFSEGKTVTEKINGTSYKLDTMIYVISEESSNQYLTDFLAGYKQGVMNVTESVYQGYEVEETRAAMESSLEVFDSFHIKGDIKITYYVDGNDYVRKILVEDFVVAMEGEDVEVTIGYEMLLGGKKHPTDNISAIITLSADGEEIEMGMTWEESFDKGVFEGELELYFEGDETSDKMGMTIEIEWDTLDKKGDNFKAELTADADDEFYIKLTGRLVDSKKSTSFSDGELTISDPYSDETVFEFDYSITMIDPKDITIDLDDSMPLMEYMEQQGTAVSGDEYET